MPYVLIVFGIALMAAALLGTQAKLYTELEADVFGTGGFWTWFIVIILIGALGYVKTLQPLSVAFMTLVLIGLILNNQGAIANLQQLVKPQ